MVCFPKSYDYPRISSVQTDGITLAEKSTVNHHGTRTALGSLQRMRTGPKHYRAWKKEIFTSTTTRCACNSLPHGICVVKRRRGALPGGEENWRGVLWSNIRGHESTQQQPSGHQVCMFVRTQCPQHVLIRRPGTSEKRCPPITGRISDI